MNSAVELHRAPASAPDDTTRAKLIAEPFERLEERYPHLRNLATQAHVRESELGLGKDIEQIRADLQTRIEQVRAELKTDIERVKAGSIQWPVPMMFAKVAVIVAPALIL